MKRLALALLLLPALYAQDVTIELDAGVAGRVFAPSTELRVTVRKREQRPLVGRVVIDLGRGVRGLRRGGTFSSEVLVTQDINLEAGPVSSLLRIDVPVGSSALQGEVRIERLVSGSYYESVARELLSFPASIDGNKVIGFISPVRMAQAHLAAYPSLSEIPADAVPENWKSLSGFDAIILNEDALTRAQAAALIDYVTMGGTLIISPRSSASFNPEMPAGSLLKLSATAPTQRRTLGEFPPLLAAPTEGWGSADQAPSPETSFTWWNGPAGARPLAAAHGLASHVPVGAGNLVLLHVNLGDPPFQSEQTLTLPAMHLLTGVLDGVIDRTGRSVWYALADRKVRNQVDIAGRRIPGREWQVLLLLLYVSAAGVGMFLLARRIKRPELYPAALLAVALLSVGLVFSFGELFKRSGDRVKAARVLVSDETTGRAGVFTLGCSYVVDGDSLTYAQHRDSLFTPTRFPSASGMRASDDVFDFQAHYTATAVETRVHSLDRWQNVFFMHREPEHEGPALQLEDLGGAWRISSTGGHELAGCIFVLGGPGAPGGQRCRWFYAPALGAEPLTLSASDMLGENTSELADRMRNDLATADDYKVMVNLLNIDPDDQVLRALTLQRVEEQLWTCGLLPDEGEYTMLAALPADALPAATLGASDADESRIGQVNLWVVRGTLDAR